MTAVGYSLWRFLRADFNVDRMRPPGANLLHRLRRLSPHQRHLLSEATLTLALVSTAIRVLPFRRAILLGSVSIGHGSPRGDVDEVVWAIRAIAARLPWRTVCLQMGLAAQRIMRRRGIDALLEYGIRQNDAADRLQAHVWVTVDGRPAIGGEEAVGFALVARYPESQTAAR